MGAYLPALCESSINMLLGDWCLGDWNLQGEEGLQGVSLPWKGGINNFKAAEPRIEVWTLRLLFLEQLFMSPTEWEGREMECPWLGMDREFPRRQFLLCYFFVLSYVFGTKAVEFVLWLFPICWVFPVEGNYYSFLLGLFVYDFLWVFFSPPL